VYDLKIPELLQLSGNEEDELGRTGKDCFATGIIAIPLPVK
jgi:hypothetical protein